MKSLMLFMLSSNHAFFKISSPGLVNGNPLKLKTIPAQTSVADQEFHPMTSSSKLNIHRSMLRFFLTRKSLNS